MNSFRANKCAAGQLRKVWCLALDDPVSDVQPHARIAASGLLENDISRFLSPRADLATTWHTTHLLGPAYNAIAWLLGPDIDGDGDGRRIIGDAGCRYRFGVLYTSAVYGQPCRKPS